MNLATHRGLLALLVAAVVGLSQPVCAVDAEAVKEKLFRAKKAYDAEIQEFRKAVLDSLDKQEDEARKAGNTDRVNRVKSEREAFEKEAALPSATPQAILDKFDAAKDKLDEAYTTAVKECLLAKADDLAVAVEKEQKQFRQNAGISDPVQTKLIRAKATYQRAMKEFREEVSSHFEARVRQRCGSN